MKTTKKIVSVILSMCMLMSTAVVSSFAAKSGEISPVSSDYARDNSYTKEATTFKVWSPTATDVKVNIYETGSDDEKGAHEIGKFVLEKMKVNGEWNGVWTLTLVGEWKDLYYTYSITTTNTTHMGSDITKKI